MAIRPDLALLGQGAITDLDLAYVTELQRGEDRPVRFEMAFDPVIKAKIRAVMPEPDPAECAGREEEEQDPPPEEEEVIEFRNAVTTSTVTTMFITIGLLNGDGDSTVRTAGESVSSTARD